MDLNARMDQFSRAVVRAIAATAGVGATVPEYDQNSEDINFTGPDGRDGPGPKLDAQLKSTQDVVPRGGAFPYDLKVKNYNDLRHPRETLYVPRILIVVHVPADPDDWFKCDSEQIVMQRCAYWVDLAGAEETQNKYTVRIDVPTQQIFEPLSLLSHLRPLGADL
jgi:Domain of unknown function (DUF4365)